MCCHGLRAVDASERYPDCLVIAAYLQVRVLSPIVVVQRVVGTATHLESSTVIAGQSYRGFLEIAGSFAASVIVQHGAFLPFLPPGKRFESSQPPGPFWDREIGGEVKVQALGCKKRGSDVGNHSNAHVIYWDGTELEPTICRHAFVNPERLVLIPDSSAVQGPQVGFPRNLDL